MKYIAVVLAGAADVAAEEIGGKTLFEAAKVPNLNHFCKTGKVGQVKLTAEKQEMAAGDSVLLNFLGYDADKVYTGRGPIEAANLGLKLEADEIPFRMNFITESDGVLADATSGKITTRESRALVNFMNKKISSGFVRFFPGAEYRHIAVLKDSHGFAALSAKAESPELIQGEKMETHFPKGPGEELLKKLMFDAKLLLQDHEINQVRVDLGENPANMVWLWGQGKPIELEKFSDLFGVSGAVVSDIEYALGIARLAGLTAVAAPENVNDERYYEKLAKSVLEVIEEKEFACIYLEGCERASVAGDFKQKVSTLESMDFHLLAKIRDYIDKNKETRVLVTPGYAVPWKTRKPLQDAVPFVAAGKNMMTGGDIEKFSENTAKASSLKMAKGSELMRFFLQK